MGYRRTQKTVTRRKAAKGNSAALLPAQREIRTLASNKKAEIYLRFFKTGPGDYGAGDQFLGVTVPQTRKIALKYKDLPLKDITHVMGSQYHEERLLGLVILVSQYQRAKTLAERHRLIRFYLQRKSAINNWDLVDLSCYKILGDYCLETNDPKLLEKLLSSKKLWDRRMAIVSTFAFIRAGQTDLTFSFAKRLLRTPEDLMHKATGWMLREAGKRNLKGLRAFLDKNSAEMPRTMLRYAIERLPKKERLHYLNR